MTSCGYFSSTYVHACICHIDSFIIIILLHLGFQLLHAQYSMLVQALHTFKSSNFGIARSQTPDSLAEVAKSLARPASVP